MVKYLVVMTLLVLPTKITQTIIETGKASWYGPGFHNKLQANGQPFNQNKVSAASNYYNLGDKLRVWQNGGDTITLKITDRMAKSTGKKRKLDLSKEAMRQIAGAEGLRKGVIEVNIQLL